MLCDYHTHSVFSMDGKGDLFAMCEAALAAGLAEIAFTEHFEANHQDPLSDQYCPYDPAAARRAVYEAKERYAGRLRILFALELGQPCEEPERTRRVLEENDYEFIIGSLHNLPGKADFYFLDYTDLDLGPLFDEYLEGLIHHVENADFDVLGHLTYALRTAARFGKTLDMADHRDGVAAVFRALIACGRGIEINTSGLRSPLNKTMPDFYGARLFRELGGQIVTVGSDAHEEENVGAGVREAYALLREAGFRYFARFENRRPVMEKL